MASPMSWNGTLPAPTGSTRSGPHGTTSGDGGAMRRRPRVRPRRVPPFYHRSLHPSRSGWIERDEPVRAARRADVTKDAHDAVHVRDEHHVLHQQHAQRARLAMPPRARIRAKRLEHRARHPGVHLGRVVDHARGPQAAHHRADVRGEMPGFRGGYAASQRRVRRHVAGDHREDVRRHLEEIGRAARIVRCHRALLYGASIPDAVNGRHDARHRVRMRDARGGVGPFIQFVCYADSVTHRKRQMKQRNARTERPPRRASLSVAHGNA